MLLTASLFGRSPWIQNAYFLIENCLPRASRIRRKYAFWISRRSRVTPKSNSIEFGSAHESGAPFGPRSQGRPSLLTGKLAFSAGSSLFCFLCVVWSVRFFHRTWAATMLWKKKCETACNYPNFADNRFSAPITEKWKLRHRRLNKLA